jgi:hypothetical protein
MEQVVEASYVGTRGRDLVSRSNGNVMPYGAMLTGNFNGIDLSQPVNRYAVATVDANLATFRRTTRSVASRCMTSAACRTMTRCS